MNEEEFIGQLAINVKREKVDSIDRKILYLLSLNARLSNTIIAKHLKLSREIVAYRIKRMQELGILHGFLTLINVQKANMHSKSVGIKLHTAVRSDELLADLQKMKPITKITQCGGMYDLLLNITGDNLESCYEVFHNILTAHGNKIKHYDIATKLGQEFTGLHLLIEDGKERKYLQKIKEQKGSTFQDAFRKQGKGKSVSPLDDTDKKILHALKHQARLPLAELSSRTGISLFQLQNRINTLITNGVILGFIPYISLAHLGLQFNIVFLNIRRDMETKFGEWVLQHPDIVWKTRHLGSHNYKLSLFVKNNSHLSDILQEVCNEFQDSVSHIESLPVFKSSFYSSF